MQVTDLNRGLANLKERYALELDRLEQKVVDAKKNLAIRDRISDHDPFNMSAICQNLAALAGKIEQTENVIRWMGEQS